MNEEYKNFLKDIFHRKDHEMYEPDYYSWTYKITAETKNTIDLNLDDNFLDKPIHDLVTNLMDEGLMITCLVIASDGNDNEWLCMQIKVIPYGKDRTWSKERHERFRNTMIERGYWSK